MAVLLDDTVRDYMVLFLLNFDQTHGAVTLGMRCGDSERPKSGKLRSRSQCDSCGDQRGV